MSSKEPIKEPIWKRLGFESLTKYRNYLAKEKGFETYTKYLEHLAIEQGFKSYSEYNKYNKQKRICRSLQEITSNVEDPKSMFKDIEFVRKITGCPVPNIPTAPVTTTEDKKKTKKKKFS